MYVYIQSERNLYTVGFYAPDGKWHPDSDHVSSSAAAARVALLNGGADIQALLDAVLGTDWKGNPDIGDLPQLQRIEYLSTLLNECDRREVFDAIAGDDPGSTHEMLTECKFLVRDVRAFLAQQGIVHLGPRKQDQGVGASMPMSN